ncbi:uncharacterized protein LOC135492610 [Lineus longissimus]|uniref:uncharacterized protein LOC135492610 n=1 Tax=Lineus longissimus TaxID=88925 RepID=UPI00315DCEE4
MVLRAKQIVANIAFIISNNKYTGGEARDLVHSCLCLAPAVGYRKSMDLLKENFGSDYKIATSFVEKALSWPAVSSEDADALKKYSLFLQGCQNTLSDMEFNELDHPTNIRELVSKLPYKLKSAWRKHAFEITDGTNGRRVKFNDFVKFVNKESRILNEPVFGNISDKPSSSSGQNQSKKRAGNKGTGKKSKGTYATSVTDAQSEETSKVKLTSVSNITGRVQSSDTSVKGTIQGCEFCSGGNHRLETCNQLRSKSHGERLDFLKSKALCFGCLQKAGHYSKFCSNRLTCHICSKSHPTVMHRNQDEDRTGIASGISPRVNSGCAGMEKQCAMSIVPVVVKAVNSDIQVNAYAFLDSGSSASFCTEELMKGLNLNGVRTKINLNTMTDVSKPVETFSVKGLEICGLNCDTFVKLPVVYTRQMLPVSKEDIPTQKDLDKWYYLQRIRLPSIDSDIGLLIGTDVPKAMEPWDVIKSEGDGPYAVKTLLGWSINGPLKGCNNPTCSSATPVSVSFTKVTLDEQLRNYYNTDFNESTVNDKEENSVEDKRFLKLVSESCKFENGHYVIGLPFKHDTVVMPDNKKQAGQRMGLLRKRFHRDNEFQVEYTAFMNNVFSKGFARKVPEEQLGRNDGRVWYLPHHAVYHPTKKKFSVVFDCGARYGGISLNDQLLQGPNLTNSLVGTLLKFRTDEVVVMADIVSMFYQARVPDDDASLLRFLWWEDSDMEKPIIEYQMVVHVFGATSSPSCANYALRRTAKDNQDYFPKEAVDAILNCFYVDDYLGNYSSGEIAIPLIANTRELCSKGGFRLT